MSTSAAAAPPPELAFQLDPTFGEHLRAQRASQRHGRGRQIRTQQLVGAVIGLGLGVFLLRGRDGSLDWTDWLLLALIGGWFLSPLPAVMHVRRMRKEAGGAARVTLAESGVTVADARGSMTLAWASFRDVAEHDGFLFFDPGDNAGFFVPVRVLREAGVLEQARELIARGRARAAADAAAGHATDADARATEPPTPPPPEVPQGPAVSAEFAPTLWEQFAAEQQVYFRSRRGRRITGYLIGVPVALLALFRWALGPQGLRDNLYLLIGGAMLALVILPAFDLFWTALGRLLSRGRPVVPVRVIVDGAGVTQEVQGARVTTAWPAIRGVQRAGGFLLFWIDRNTAHYLPVRTLDAASLREASGIIRRHAGERAAL